MPGRHSRQFPKPKDHQEFERCGMILFRCVLKDESAHLHGRSGQKQQGVDLIGYRDGDPQKAVGVQFKLKKEGQPLTEKEVREEVVKASQFSPSLSEYIIATTSPNDSALDRVAIELSKTYSEQMPGAFCVRIFGWETLEDEINEHAAAANAFDPSYTPYIAHIESKLTAMGAQIGEILVCLQQHAEIALSGDTHSLLDRQLNDCARMLSNDPGTALNVLDNIQRNLGSDVSVSALFRVNTNIAACYLELADEENAARLLVDAFSLDPSNPKAVANKAFGLALQGDWPALKTFAESTLEEFSDNVGLAACYVGCAIHDETIQDPLARMSDDIVRAAEVAAAHIQWLHVRGEKGAWWDAAVRAQTEHPDDGTIKEFYACALLDRVLDGEGFSYGIVLGEDECREVNEALDILESRWRRVRDASGHVRGASVSVPHNLMIAHQLQNNSEKVIEVGGEAIARFPDHAALLKKHTGLTLLMQGELDRAQDMLSGDEVTQDTVMVFFDMAVDTGKWRDALDLVNAHLDMFPESERERASAAKVRAETEMDPGPNRRSIMEAGRRMVKGDPRALIMLAEGARLNDLDDLSTAYFQTALNALDNKEDWVVDRIHVAGEAMARGYFAKAIDLLIDHVRRDREGPDLRLLAIALATHRPTHERATRFFQQLAPNIRRQPFFRRLEGILHISCGSPQIAIEPFADVFEQDPNISNLGRLIGAHFMAGDGDSIREILQRTDIDSLSGETTERIGLYNICFPFGDQTSILEGGYDTLVNDPDDLVVVQGFLRLVSQALVSQRLTDEDLTVSFGVWVRLTAQDGRSYGWLVDEPTDRRWGLRGAPSNILVAKTIGLKTKDTFDFVTAARAQVTWTVSEVMPRWLRAFYYLQEHFEQMFPQASLLWGVRLREG